MKRVCLLAWLMSGLRSPAGAAPKLELVSAPSGFVMVAANSEGLAIASDGASQNADGTLSESAKIFPAGRYAAVLCVGAVSLQDPVTASVRQEVNIPRIVESWLHSHPHPGPGTANREINSVVWQALQNFGRRHKSRTSVYQAAVIVVSWTNGRGLLAGAQYSVPRTGREPAARKSLSAPLEPGVLWIFGAVKVAQELANSKLSALAAYKAEPAIKKWRAVGTKPVSLLDYLDVFDTILRASESPAGKAFSGVSAVAPPNSFATITNVGFGRKSAKGL